MAGPRYSGEGWLTLLVVYPWSYPSSGGFFKFLNSLMTAAVVPEEKTITSVYPMKLPSHCGLTNGGRKIIFEIGDLLKRICFFPWDFHETIPLCSDFRAKTPSDFPRIGRWFPSDSSFGSLRSCLRIVQAIRTLNTSTAAAQDLR